VKNKIIKKTPKGVLFYYSDESRAAFITFCFSRQKPVRANPKNTIFYFNT
jgi:hypothetical protein